MQLTIRKQSPLKWMSTVLMVKAFAESEADWKINVEYLSKQGGFLGMLADVATKALPTLLERLAIGLMSGTVEKAVDAGGLYLHPSGRRSGGDGCTCINLDTWKWNREKGKDCDSPLTAPRHSLLCTEMVCT